MKKITSKVMENKEEKKRKILDVSFDLFKEKGFKDTTIQDIVDKAGIAKGTFYLYFKDKYDLQDYIIVKKSEQLFKEAIEYVNKKNIKDFEERFISIIDYLIDDFANDKQLLMLISKDLSLGVFGDRLSSFVDNKVSIGILEEFEKIIKDNNLPIKNPKITLYMVIELTSSVVFTSIILNEPLPIEELKPYLYEKIKKILLD
jgi:AcrR family transcriptional regulator